MYCPLKFGRGWEVVEKQPDLAVCETQDCMWWSATARACAIRSLAQSAVHLDTRLANIADYLQEMCQSDIMQMRHHE